MKHDATAIRIAFQDRLDQARKEADRLRSAFAEFVEEVDAAIDKPAFPPRCTQELADEIQIASVKARKALYG